MHSDRLACIKFFFAIFYLHCWSAGSHLCRSGGHGKADEVRIYQPAQPLYHMPQWRQHCPTRKLPAIFGHR